MIRIPRELIEYIEITEGKISLIRELPAELEGDFSELVRVISKVNDLSDLSEYKEGR